jgi:predicted dehydrogenase
MVRVGLIGVGFMGWIHFLAQRRCPELQLVAVSTRDAARLSGDWRGIQGNFGPPGEMVDLSHVARYADWRDLLRDPSVDVVDICLPPYLHAEVAVAAAAAGKHVFCEKPLALSVEEANRMVEAATTAGTQLYVGHVLPFLPEYAAAREIQASGRYGRLLGGHFRRVIADPQWLPDFYNPTRVGGPLLDLLVHDTHFIRYFFGSPRSVSSQGRTRGEVVEYCQSQFSFDDPDVLVSLTGGVMRQAGRPFLHGYELHWERATLTFEFAVLSGGQPPLVSPLTLFTSEGEVLHPPLPDGDPMLNAFAAELAEMAHCVAAQHPSPLLGGDLARDAIALCHAQAESVRTHRPQTLSS